MNSTPLDVTYMSTIKTEVQEISETRKKVNVDIAAAEIDGIQKQLVKEFQHEAKIPGFRPGKTPENLIRMRFAKELKTELANRVINRAYQEGVGRADFEVFSLVESSEAEVIAGQDASVSFTVDVVQEFEVPDYKSLKVIAKSTEPSAEEIDAVIKQILSQRAEFKPVEKAAETGDYVKCSYEGKVGEELIAEMVPDKPMWGTQKNTWEEAGTDHPYGVPAIIEGLVGMKAGDTKEVTMNFAEDFRIEALAGKTAVYSLEVAEVREKILPEMDKAFFESMQMKDEEELRASISKNLEEQKRQQNLSHERQQIIDQLLKSVDFAMPESGIESIRQSILIEHMQHNIEQGVSKTDFEENKEKLHDEAGKTAHVRLKTELILKKIAQKENVEVDTNDLGRMIMAEAQETGQKPEKIVKELQQDQARLNFMRNGILIGKTLDLILEKAEREIVVESSEFIETA